MKKESKGLMIVGGLAAAGVAAYAFSKAKAAPPPPPPPGLATLWGIVSDAYSGKGIGGITVALNGWNTTTASSGRYEFREVEPGEYSLDFVDPLGRYEAKTV